MVLGVDFDNTIACYEHVFHQTAVDQRLIPPEVPRHKNAVRDYLRRRGQEAAWTVLQGYVYGTRMHDVSPFVGVKECLAHCVRQGISVYIISHKTQYPYSGPQYNLHQAAQQWLEQQGFWDQTQVGLLPKHVFFELTKQAKIARIITAGCTHFIDDLPEFLADTAFPTDVERILFNPNDRHSQHSHFRQVNSWKALEHSMFRDMMPSMSS